jgi:hypothetical protein
VPRRAQPLATVRATATLKGGGGALPVEFTLKNPSGRESVVSGVRATTGGRAVFEWTPAGNDPAGNWTLTATELATGKSVKRTIQLAAKIGGPDRRDFLWPPTGK